MVCDAGKRCAMYFRGPKSRWQIWVVLCMFMTGSLLPWSAVTDGRAPASRELDLKRILFAGEVDRHATTHVLLWTQMRSGSSFTGDLLTASPHTFYTEEPLRGSKLSGMAESVAFLKDILQCRFSEQPRFLNKWLNGVNGHDYRTKLLCPEFPGVCKGPSLVEAMCRAARARVVRVVSGELGVAAALLEDGGLSARVIHLVRDPRALVASRERFRNGTHGKYLLAAGMGFRQEEKDPSAVCARYRRDMAARSSFVRLYPDRYVLVRYEDLALDAERVMRRLYPFMRLPYTAAVASAVAFHTLRLEEEDHPYSTIKNAKSTVFAWRQHLPFRDMERIQRECGDVLEAYGYRSFHTPREYGDLKVSPLSLTEEEVNR